ncbi:MAG: hypothetical protein KKA42_01215 [candidate division Zixibacteria bacterium]|nr:hypothetical protein [candidate division Zixibacteria bacterium]
MVHNNVGVIITLLVIAGGLVWLLVRSFRGKEIDRRVIFLFIMVSVAAPLLATITFKFTATPIVEALYDKIEALPEGSTVLLSFDFDPAMAPEVQPMANVVTRHCLEKNIKIVFMCLWATGQGQLEITLDQVLRRDFAHKIDGVDYVNMGYKAGNEGVLNVIVTDFEKMFPTDVNTTPYGDIEILQGVNSCKDMDLIVSFGGGRPGIKEWILFVGDPTGVPSAGGVAAVVAPQLYPYYPRQLMGLLGGIKGAAEYESHFRERHPNHADMDTPAIIMMGPQTIAHIVIIAFIIIGNVLFFMNRRRGARS